MMEWKFADDVQEIIRTILKSRGICEATEEQCKEFAREYVTDVYAWWQPGIPLSWKEAVKVGEQLNKEHKTARRILGLDKDKDKR